MLVELGRFGRPQGVKGDLRLWPHNPSTELISKGMTLFVGDTAANAKPRLLATVRVDGKGMVARLEGVEDRDQAAALSGLGWFMERTSFPAAREGEVYVVDLIGITARTPDGTVLGEVVDVTDAGGGELLVIKRDRREYLVPNVPAFVQSIDLEARQVVVTPIDGLFEDEHGVE